MIWLNIVAIGVVVVGDVSIEMRSFWTKLWWLGPTATMENNLDRKKQIFFVSKSSTNIFGTENHFSSEGTKTIGGPDPIKKISLSLLHAWKAASSNVTVSTNQNA